MGVSVSVGTEGVGDGVGVAHPATSNAISERRMASFFIVTHSTEGEMGQHSPYISYTPKAKENTGFYDELMFFLRS
jgi:hypothetical protein